MEYIRKHEIFEELKNEIIKAGYKNQKRFFGANGMNINQQVSESEKAKQQMLNMFNCFLSSATGDLELANVVCAVLKIDVYERFPDLKGEPRRKCERAKNVFTEPITEKQKQRLKQLEKENGIQIVCESKWGAWFILNKNIKGESEESYKKEIIRVKEKIESLEQQIGHFYYGIQEARDLINRKMRDLKEAQAELFMLEYREAGGE